jgi:hypothetical protein
MISSGSGGLPVTIHSFFRPLSVLNKHSDSKPQPALMTAIITRLIKKKNIFAQNQD